MECITKGPKDQGMFAGTLLQVLQTSFLSSRLSFSSSVIAADGRQLEDLACSPLVGLKGVSVGGT